MEKTIRTTRQIVIDQILNYVNLNDSPTTKVLEPSAGKGDLVKGILDAYPNLDLDCVELNKESREVLIEKGYLIQINNFKKKNESFMKIFI